VVEQRDANDGDVDRRRRPADRRSQVVAWSLATEALEFPAIRMLEAWLDPAERARARRLAVPTDRRDFIAAHGLLREMLGRTFELAPNELRLLPGARGAKPRMVAPGCIDLDVNISHCRGLVACIGGFGCSVGIDAEAFDLEVDTSLAEQFFSREEVRWLRSQPRRTASANFLRLWTLKEALAKADGGGLGIGLDRCVVLPDPPRLLALPPQMGAISEWILRQWTPTPRHVVAMACRIPEGEGRTVNVVDLG
jgi:4'-phosphopantetheinyl transferase